MASGFGWYLFPQTDVSLRWDGSTIFYQLDDMPDWLPVADGVGFPGPYAAFLEQAPDSVRAVPPPASLTAIPEPGIIQVSLGIAARSAPGWGLLLRRPANYPVPGAIEHFEGVIDPAGWFGPMFINLRITRTDTPVRLYSDRPLVQAQPVPIALLKTDTTNVADMGDDEWADWAQTVTEPLGDPNRDFGGYAVRARKLRKSGTCPFNGNTAQ